MPVKRLRDQPPPAWGEVDDPGAAVAGIEWLYRVTGQRGGEESTDALADYFRPYGFAVEVRQEPCPRSLATVIIAQNIVGESG